MAHAKVGIGIVGCGNISDIYLQNCINMFDNIEVIGCADINRTAAEDKAKKYGIKAMEVEELLYHPQVEIIVNLTTPQAHKKVSMMALEAGKHTYIEKPLALELEDGLALIEKAKEKDLLIGGAPDTFLGAGIQTCAQLIEEGAIGKPIGATAFMTCHGHESWHPHPDFYYKKGGGPMFDMGPYYITALIALMGCVKRVAGMAQISTPTRTITSQPRHGEIINVEVPTHISGLMEFESGATGAIMTSFDVWGSELSIIEIYGTKGTLSVPDPNTFGGPVRIKGQEDNEFVEIPLRGIYEENSRGLGISDMAKCILTGEPNKANGELTFHVLQVMHGFFQAAEEGRYVSLR